MTMIERVAFSLCVSDGYARPFGSAEDSWAADREDVRARYRTAARAALEALRMPTDAMLQAGSDQPYLANSEAPLVFAEIRELIAPENIWIAMIDATLEEVE